MRILSEIIDDITNGEMPSHEECYYALKAYRGMLNIMFRELKNELLMDERQPQEQRITKAELAFSMYKSALSKSPKEWVGESE